MNPEHRTAPDARYCAHGNGPTCPRCRRERVHSFIEHAKHAEVEPARIETLERDLLRTHKLLREGEVPFWIAGGTGIDLLDGEWNRDHQDLDVSIMGDQRGTFYDLVTKHGYEIFFPEEGGTRRMLSKTDIEDPELHNAFVFTSDEHGPHEFEVIFLDESEQGIALPGNAHADTTIFQEAPTIAIQNTEFNIQPPEVTLFHKLLDGRRKDLLDAQTALEHMDQAQRSRLQSLLTEANVTFDIDGRIASTLEDILELGSQREEELRSAFSKTIDEITDEVSENLSGTLDVIDAIRHKTSDPASFRKALAEHYGGHMPARKDRLDQVIDFLFEGSVPSRDNLQTWTEQTIGVEDAVKSIALHRYRSQKLWTTTSV